MEPGSVKDWDSAKRASRDRLSELPDEVLVNILSCLPTLDAVRTVLLRRFGNLWTLVHSLSFSDYPFGSHTHPDTLSLFSKFVLNVLVLHRRHTIKKFLIEIEDGNAELEIWLRFALSREVEELTLDIYPRDVQSCILPYCVFSSRSLVSLELTGCSIVKQTRVHMESLRKVTFDRVNMDGETLAEIIYGAPLLEELSIQDTYGKLWITSANLECLNVLSLEKVTIDCPNLKTLSICSYLNSLEIIDVSSLSDAALFFHSFIPEKSYPMTPSFLEKMGNAKVMKLSYYSHLSLHNICFPQNRWKHLILSWIPGTHMLLIHRLLRNSLCLEELTIHEHEDDENFTYMFQDTDDDIDANIIIEELSSPYELPQLKTVTIHGFQKGLLELAEFILKHALNLEKLRFVDEVEKQTLAEKLDFVTQVANFQRVSAKAKVVFV